MLRVPAVIDEPLTECLTQVFDASKVAIVSGAFAGKQCVYRMVEIVAPLRVKSITAALDWPQHPRIVAIAFRDHIHAPVQLPSTFMDGFAKFLQNVLR